MGNLCDSIKQIVTCKFIDNAGDEEEEGSSVVITLKRYQKIDNHISIPHEGSKEQGVSHDTARRNVAALGATPVKPFINLDSGNCNNNCGGDLKGSVSSRLAPDVHEKLLESNDQAQSCVLKDETAQAKETSRIQTCVSQNHPERPNRNSWQSSEDIQTISGNGSEVSSSHGIACSSVAANKRGSSSTISTCSNRSVPLSFKLRKFAFGSPKLPGRRSRVKKNRFLSPHNLSVASQQLPVHHTTEADRDEDPDHYANAEKQLYDYLTVKQSRLIVSSWKSMRNREYDAIRVFVDLLIEVPTLRPHFGILALNKNIKREDGTINTEMMAGEEKFLCESPIIHHHASVFRNYIGNIVEGIKRPELQTEKIEMARRIAEFHATIGVSFEASNWLPLKRSIIKNMCTSRSVAEKAAWSRLISLIIGEMKRHFFNEIRKRGSSLSNRDTTVSTDTNTAGSNTIADQINDQSQSADGECKTENRDTKKDTLNYGSGSVG